MSKTIAGILAVIIALIAINSMFIVDQRKFALKLRLGRVVGAGYEPGLNFKLPFIENIRYFEKRIQTLDTEPERFLTSEKKNVIVDSFVKWRIINVVDFYTAVRGNEQIAGQRLTEIIADGLRGKFGTRTIQEVVSGDRTEIMESITEETDAGAQRFGIKVVDVRIKRIDLPQEVSDSVYQRMRAERERVARDLRSQGEAEAVRIRAKADRTRVELLSEAQRKAEEIRGEGDAEAAATYADAFSQDEEFYALYRSLSAYRNTFKDKGDVLVVEPDARFFQYFKESKQGTAAPAQ
ncbi:MAG: protease modulator HflC [Pseudomonadota bacterium]